MNESKSRVGCLLHIIGTCWQHWSKQSINNQWALSSRFCTVVYIFLTYLKIWLLCATCLQLNGRNEDFLTFILCYGCKIKNKIRPALIDSSISAELPPKKDDPVLHEAVLKHMIYGPCGTLNTNSPYMRESMCTKNDDGLMIAWW